MQGCGIIARDSAPERRGAETESADVFGEARRRRGRAPGGACRRRRRARDVPMNNDATRHLAADSFLFPLPEPSAIGRLPVDARHTLYWEECGNRDGHAGDVPARRPRRGLPAAPPAVLRSGLLAHRAVRPARRGPLDAQRRADRQHHGHLVADMEKLRAHLGIERCRAVRRLLGLDPRHRLRRDPSAALSPGWCCAACSSPRPTRSTGSCTAWAASFPEAGTGCIADSCPPRSATTCCAPTIGG